MESDRRQAELEQQLGLLVSHLSQLFAQDTALLRATRSFLNMLPSPLSRERFSRFIQGLEKNRPDRNPQDIGFATLIPEGGLSEIEAWGKREYGDDFRVWPQGERGPESAVLLIEPPTRSNLAAIGFDMMSEANRRQTMIAAMAAPGTVQATPPLIPVSIRTTEENPVSLILYAFVQGHGESAMPGFVYSLIEIGPLFESALIARQTDLAIRAIDSHAPDMVLYHSEGFAAGESRAETHTTVSFAGRTWQLTLQDRSSGLLGRTPFTLVTGVLMALLTLTSTLAANGMQMTIERARRLNAAQAQLMREKDLHLREMSHRLKNSLTRVTAIARQAARGAETKQEFVASMNTRLMAMARAQDMLTRSDGGRADLHQLLRAELAQIFGDTGPFPAELSGPEVLLDPRMTQALGLSIHELATNALKYGAGAVEGATLEIRWQIEEAPAGPPVLALTWDERLGQAAEPPERSGFGSQLLETCIRLELGGEIRRLYHDNGVTVHIRVPMEDWQALPEAS